MREGEDIPGYNHFPVFDEESGDSTDEGDSTDSSDEGDSADSSDTDDLATLKRELAKTKRALTKANREAADRRTAAKTLTDEQKAAASRVAALESQVSEGRAVEALREAGAQGTRAKLVKLVKLLDSTDSAEIEGAIEELKTEFPNLFEAAKAAGPPKLPRKGSGDGGDGKQGGPPGLSSTSKKMLGIK